MENFWLWNLILLLLAQAFFGGDVNSPCQKADDLSNISKTNLFKVIRKMHNNNNNSNNSNDNDNNNNNNNNNNNIEL